MVGRLLASLLIKFRPIKFKQWIELEDQKFRIAKSYAERREEFPKLVNQFLSIAFPILPRKYIDQLYWADCVRLFNRVGSKTVITKYLPLVAASAGEKVPDNKQPWEYDGRSWHFYSHMIAKEYGWSLEYIADLCVYDALAIIEEILLDEQFQKEFMWGMSEASVVYDSRTKTSKPNPLPRPYWMKSVNPAEPLPIKRIRIPSHMLPVGVVNYDSVTDDYKPKEVAPQPSQPGGNVSGL